MISYLLPVILLNLTVNNLDNYEEATLTYFFSEIFPEEYSDKVSFRFDGMTQQKFTIFGVQDNCFNKLDYDFKIKLDSTAHAQESLALKRMPLSNRNFRQHNRSLSANELRVFRATKVDDRFYVAIILNFKSDRSDSFFFELSIDGMVIKWCKSSLIY